jgi:predicted ribosome quality control (RQC) complex YloA/Tae2 family protein
MPFDGVLLHHLIHELRPLVGSQLQRIRQTTHDEFLFSCYQTGSSRTLLISPHPEDARVHLTNKDPEATHSSHFLSILKHHIEQGFIKEISQYHNDRVLILTIQKTNPIGQSETFELIAELMNRHSNLFLVKDGITMDSFRRVPPFSEATRTVLPNTPYSYPEESKPNPFLGFNASTFEKAMAYQGMSPLLADAIEHRGLSLTSPVTPSLSPSKGLYHVYDCFEDSVVYPTISAMLDAYYFEFKQEKRHQQQIKDITRVMEQKIQKAETKLAHLEADLEDGKAKDEWKHYGDLLYAQAHTIQKGQTSVTLMDFDGLSSVTIPLQETKTPQENAALYFKKYQKAKKALAHVAEQQAETRLEIQYLNEQLYDVQHASPDVLAEQRLVATTRKKSTAKPKAPKQFLHEDVVFYVGRNAKQNEVVTFELAKPSDLWLHVKDAPGAHVIAKTTNVTEAILRYGANLAACYSASRYSSSVEVQYTTRKHIKKIPGYPGSMVQVTKYNTIYIDPECSLVLDEDPSQTKTVSRPR